MRGLYTSLICSCKTASSSDESAVCFAGKPSKEAGGANEQQFVRDVIELHDKYLLVRCSVDANIMPAKPFTAASSCILAFLAPQQLAELPCFIMSSCGRHRPDYDGAVQYVTECFSNSSLFHKALKEAFEQFCNKQVGGSSSAELMASFCDNLLKKVNAPF